MTRKRIDLNTCVWGEWHLDAMRRVMLPTLLSSGNLPEINRRFGLRYRIATTPDGRRSIESWPIFGSLASTVEIEWITEKSSPDITYHIERYVQSLGEAKDANAYCFMIHPDVAWSEGLLARCAAAIASGKAGIAIPYIRVISETFVPEIAGRAGDAPIELSSGELVRMAMRHAHPLTAATSAAGCHALPSLEVSWRVPEQGLLLRQMSRALSMIDPTRLQASQSWNTINAIPSESLHISTDSDDMLMLSLAPLFKDFQAYNPNHALRPMDLARVSLHPANNNQCVEYFAARPIRLHYDGIDANRWRGFERRADRFVGQALIMRGFLRIWEAARAAECSFAAQVMSVALMATSLASRGRSGPVTVYIPSDDAFGQAGVEAFAHLLHPGSASELERIVLNHVTTGVRRGAPAGPWQQNTLGGTPLRGRSDSGGEFVNDARVVRRLDLLPHQVCFIDRLLVPISAAIGSMPDSSSSQPLPTETGDRDAAAGQSSAKAELLPASHAGSSSHVNVADSANDVSSVADALAATPRRRAAQWWHDDEEIAQQYQKFLCNFYVELEQTEFERQTQAVASVLYQAGLYRHKWLFLYDNMKQFAALGGATDPQLAFFDYCFSQVGGEEDLLRAEHYYCLALRFIPQFAEVLYALGRLKRRAGLTADAATLFEAAASAPPHPNAVTHAHIAANSWRNLAQIHRDLGNDEAAEACFSKAIHYHGIHGVYQADIAAFLRARGRIAEAVQQYELAMPYTHLYPCEFTEPDYPPEQRLPVGLDGKPCDPLTPTVVGEGENGAQLVYWWHLLLPVPQGTPLDTARLFKMKPQARLLWTSVRESQH